MKSKVKKHIKSNLEAGGRLFAMGSFSSTVRKEGEKEGKKGVKGERGWVYQHCKADSVEIWTSSY